MLPTTSQEPRIAAPIHEGKMAKDGKTNLIDAALQKQFIEMRDLWEGLNKRAKDAASKRTKYQAEIKKAGFSLNQIKTAIQLSTPEGETRFRSDMANLMLAAAYAGAAVGDQLALFLEPDRTPAVDHAAHEGKVAAMENKAHNPPYDPSVPQYKAWSDAFYAEQERVIKAGIKKLDATKAAENAGEPEPAKKRGRPAKSSEEATDATETTLITKAEKEAKAAEKAAQADAAPPRKPKAAEPVTRASLAKQKADARELADSYFSKSTAGNA